jgi:hypothetical protein
MFHLPKKREFDSPILQARRACKIVFLRGWRDAPPVKKTFVEFTLKNDFQ